MYEENHFLAFHITTRGTAGEAAHDNESRIAANTKILVRIGFRALSGDRPRMRRSCGFTDSRGERAAQKCFKPELQSSQIMNIQSCFNSQTGNLPAHPAQ